jgi:hypothetical protein
MVKSNGRNKPQRGAGRIRGLTKAEYLVLSRMVRRGETTWEELERRGIALPPQRESDFRRQVKRALAGHSA